MISDQLLVTLILKGVEILRRQTSMVAPEGTCPRLSSRLDRICISCINKLGEGKQFGNVCFRVYTLFYKNNFIRTRASKLVKNKLS